MAKSEYNWLYIAAIIIAVIAAFYTGIPTTATTTILAILGIIIGLVNVTSKEANGFLVATVALIVASLTSKGLEDIILIGQFIPPILVNIVYIVAPAAIVVALKAINETARNK